MTAANTKIQAEPDRADAFLQDAASVAEQTDAKEVLVSALYERSLLAMDRGDWSQAEDLADQARVACRRPGPGSSSPASTLPSPT